MRPTKMRVETVDAAPVNDLGEIIGTLALNDPPGVRLRLVIVRGPDGLEPVVREMSVALEPDCPLAFVPALRRIAVVEAMRLVLHASMALTDDPTRCAYWPDRGSWIGALRQLTTA